METNDRTKENKISQDKNIISVIMVHMLKLVRENNQKGFIKIIVGVAIFAALSAVTVLGVRSATIVYEDCVGQISEDWRVGANTCSGDLLATSHGETLIVKNTVPGLDGSIIFTCNDGLWEDDPSYTCTNEVFDNFGQSVATDGTRVIVGGSKVVGGEDNNEGVHIYETINADGTLSGRVLLPKTSDIGSTDGFGHSVGISGNYAIVGSPKGDNYDKNEESFGAGSAYIYERRDSGWSNPIALTIPSGLETNDDFGEAVAIDGDYAIVGAPNDDNGRGNGAGSAYIYERGNNGWSNPIALRLPNGIESSTSFSYSVAISGNYAIVGAPFDDNERGEGAGSAYIYERRDSGWSNPIALRLPNGIEEGSIFGLSVSISGDYAIVGAPEDSNAEGREAGSAYIYERSNQGRWSNPISLRLPSNIEVESVFGASVGISGNYAIVGAPGDDNNGVTDTGSTYIYERASSRNWGNPIVPRLPIILERDSRLGWSVAISQNYAIVGAPEDDNVLGEDAGSIYTYGRAGTRNWNLLEATRRE